MNIIGMGSIILGMRGRAYTYVQGGSHTHGSVGPYKYSYEYRDGSSQYYIILGTGGGGGGALKLGVVMTLDIMPGYLESSGAKPISLLLAINAGYESMLVLAIFFVIVFPAFFSTLLVVAMCRLSTACHP